MHFWQTGWDLRSITLADSYYFKYLNDIAKVIKENIVRTFTKLREWFKRMIWTTTYCNHRLKDHETEVIFSKLPRDISEANRVKKNNSLELISAMTDYIKGPDTRIKLDNTPNYTKFAWATNSLGLEQNVAEHSLI